LILALYILFTQLLIINILKALQVPFLSKDLEYWLVFAYVSLFVLQSFI